MTELINNVRSGYSASVIAYGQTGSGKTHTMIGGHDWKGNIDLDSERGTHGLVPRSLQLLFQQSKESNDGCSISATYCEIYNEQVYDLLHQNSPPLNIKWSTHSRGQSSPSPAHSKRPKGHYFVEGLTTVQCTELGDVLNVLAEGSRVRRVRNHLLNMQSSRSHAIFTVYITWTTSCEKFEGKTVKSSKTSKMVFVDLAGSERLKQSQSIGEGVKETTNINRSLFALGNVISALSEKPGRSRSRSSGTKASKEAPQIVVPYRDSILTKLLMDSLGGNCLTIMIGCVTPSNAYIDETIQTLNYASRACRIRNHPTVTEAQTWTEIVSTLQRQIQELSLENERLRQQVKESSKSDMSSSNVDGFSATPKTKKAMTEVAVGSQVSPGYRKLITFTDSPSPSAQSGGSDFLESNVNPQERNEEPENNGSDGEQLKNTSSSSVANKGEENEPSSNPASIQTPRQAVNSTATPTGRKRRLKSLSLTPSNRTSTRLLSSADNKAGDKTKRGSASSESLKHAAKNVDTDRSTNTGRRKLAPVRRHSVAIGAEKEFPQSNQKIDAAVSTDDIMKTQSNSGDSNESEALTQRKMNNEKLSRKQERGKGGESILTSPQNGLPPKSAGKPPSSRKRSTSRGSVELKPTRMRRHSIADAGVRSQNRMAQTPKVGSKTPTVPKKQQRRSSLPGKLKLQHTNFDFGSSEEEVSAYDHPTSAKPKPQHSKLSSWSSESRRDSTGTPVSADPYSHPGLLSHPLSLHENNLLHRQSSSVSLPANFGEEGHQLKERIDELKRREMQLLVKLSSQEQKLRARQESRGDDEDS